MPMKLSIAINLGHPSCDNFRLQWSRTALGISGRLPMPRPNLLLKVFSGAKFFHKLSIAIGGSGIRPAGFYRLQGVRPGLGFSGRLSRPRPDLLLEIFSCVKFCPKLSIAIDGLRNPSVRPAPGGPDGSEILRAPSQAQA